MDKPLTAKQTSFVQYFADAGSDTFNNIEQSMLKAGYAKNYARHWNNKILANDGISKANTKYRAKTAEKLDHNRQIAIDILNEALAIARTKQDSNGIVQACRELDAISNLHSQRILTEVSEAKPLTEQEVAELKKLAGKTTVIKLQDIA